MEKFEEFLSGIMKPGRYIGNEWNVSVKDSRQAEVSCCLCFPDLYEVGMSNLGIRILYGILNAAEGVACERCFFPEDDFAAALRSAGLPLFSLESQRPLKEFDIVGISLGYELGYTNALALLELAGIPLEAVGRTALDPLVIGGGPCALNPEPMYKFFDLFIIGEAEEAFLELTGLLRTRMRDLRAGKLGRPELLAECSRIEGVYVPSLYEVRYTPEGKIAEFLPRAGAPAVVRKRIIKDLENAFFPRGWLVPYIEIIHDRIVLELSRGCPNRCRFCQARSLYYPLRQRTPQKAFGLAQELYAATGYEELSLIGLSVSDYPQIASLLADLVAAFKPHGVSVSLPSIKPNLIVGDLSSLISTIKKTGLTFAPEAATEKLRRILNKDFSREEFTRVLERAYAAGYQRVKLYFMIGLPGEEEADVDAIIDFANEVSALRKKNGGASAFVNVSVNTLIPKPHTPFQWQGMLPLSEIEARQTRLRGALKNRKVKLAMHDGRMSFIEGVLARGDRRLADVILSAMRHGAHFDAWENHFSYEKWLAAFAEQGIDPAFYLKAKEENELLPWDFLDVCVPRQELENEARLAAEILKSCCNKTT